MYNRLHAQVGSLIKEVATLAYYMKGGMSYNDIMYSMTYIERDISMTFAIEQVKSEYKLMAMGGIR